MACLTAIVAVLVLIKVKYVLPIDFALVIYFSAIAYISQHIICRTLAKNPKKFPQSFMLVEFGKLFLHIIVLAASIYFYFRQSVSGLFRRAVPRISCVRHVGDVPYSQTEITSKQQ